MKLDAKQAQALVNLRGNHDFEVFLEGVKENVNGFLQECAEREGPSLHRSQGSAKALQALLKAFTDAPTTLDKFKSIQQQGK